VLAIAIFSRRLPVYVDKYQLAESEKSEGISLPVAGAGEWEPAGPWLHMVGMPGPGGCGCGCSSWCQGLNSLAGTARRGV